MGFRRTFSESLDKVWAQKLFDCHCTGLRIGLGQVRVFLKEVLLDFWAFQDRLASWSRDDQPWNFSGGFAPITSCKVVSGSSFSQSGIVREVSVSSCLMSSCLEQLEPLLGSIDLVIGGRIAAADNLFKIQGFDTNLSTKASLYSVQST